MMSHGYEVEIGDYVDGTLPPAQRAALEAHLAECDTCRATVADFRTVRAAAATLDTHTPPPRVWARIAADLDTPVSRSPLTPRWFTFGLAWKSAVAAAVIVVLLAAGAWFSWREVATRHEGIIATTANAGTAASPEPTVEQHLRTEISSIEGIARSESSMLPGETRAAYQAGIDEIDSALDRPRAVLATEPSNEQAQQSLFELLQSKLTLLREMIALINEMRKGNQEEAARIVSGTEP